MTWFHIYRLEFFITLLKALSSCLLPGLFYYFWNEILSCVLPGILYYFIEGVIFMFIALHFYYLLKELVCEAVTFIVLASRGIFFVSVTVGEFALLILSIALAEAWGSF